METMLLKSRAENTIKGENVKTAPTQLETTYAQHPCRCKTNTNTMIIGKRTTAPQTKILKC
jgi:hypothetical protein